jgi:N-acetylglucosamine kinase-like BadF-type ATPase
LTARVLQLFGEETVENVLHRMTVRAARTVVDHCALTSALLAEAESGDCTAHRIVREHGRWLGDYAVAAAARTGIEESDFVLVLTGGVLKNPGSMLRDSIVARAQEAYPRVRPVVSPHEPVVGALLLALEAAGVVVTNEVMARIVATIPS